jgi:hypothetical protein
MLHCNLVQEVCVRKPRVTAEEGGEVLLLEGHVLL